MVAHFIPPSQRKVLAFCLRVGSQQLSYSRYTYNSYKLQRRMGSKNGKMVLREEDVAALAKTSGLRKAPSSFV